MLSTGLHLTSESTRLEPEAFSGGEVGREDDLLDVLVGCPVDIQVARQPST